MGEVKHTACDLLPRLRADNPTFRFAASRAGNAVGYWCPRRGRFVPLLMLACTGEWAHTEQEIWINGAPPYAAEDWEEG